MNSKKTSKQDIGVVLEQYKLAVEMADRVSSRRSTNNSFHIGLHALFIPSVISIIGNDLLSEPLFILFPVIIGAGVSYFWLVSLKSYKALNKEKFRIICEIEKSLPIKIYTDEWEGIKNKRRHKTLTQTEYCLPVACLLIYTGIALFLLFNSEIIKSLILSL